MKSQAWWFMPIIPILGRLRQEDQDFEASLEAKDHYSLTTE
jgi:hypothetical protein